MFGPWIEIFLWAKSLLPDASGFKFKLPRIHFTFILLHYTYLISLTIIGSIILYGAGNLDYIDCLFFGSGAATQSGLNTVNINDLHLYQQITLMLLACIATPIFINTFVVFVRLYWFEKRFQHVVLEAQKFRRTRDRSRTKSQARGDDLGAQIEKEERGVGGRRIVVMHPGAKTMELAEHPEKKIPKRPAGEGEEEEEGSYSGAGGNSDTSETPGNSQSGTHDTEEIPEEITKATKQDSNESSAPSQPFHRNIMFADEVIKPSRGQFDADEHPDDLLANRRTKDQHIAFLENQRNPKDKGTLYIPGPRDFDQGKGPQEIDDEHTLALQRSRIEIPQTPLRESGDGFSGRKALKNKLSLDDATNAFAKAKHGVLSLLLPQSQHDVNEVEKTHLPSRVTEEPESPTLLRKRGRAHTFTSFMTTRDDDVDPMPYLSYQATIGRNSAFVNLTEEQREELGGIEYRALKTLAIVLVVYYVGFHIFGTICMVPWIVRSRRYSDVVRADGQSPVWWGFFTEASLFNDLGFTLTPDSMISFQYAVFPLLIGSWLIIVGNTGFPCMLRFVIWVLSKVVPRGSSVWEEFRFLLDHPRRCFTLLFPSKATWWLFWVLVILNVLDLIFFIVLDLGDETVSSLPPGIRVLAGWFQAASTRTAGFAVVNLAELHPGVQVSYLIMMYISIFPIAISVRRTNVYEEKSLGVWQPHQDDDADESSPTQSYIGNHLRRQLSFDLWYVFLGLFVIAIVEGSRLSNTNEYAFTIFSVLFEVVSAYGTVGLSLGYPNVDTSFSGQFHVISKLVIIAMQIRGRHRGLPYALDKAILLPSEEQQRKENEEGLRRMERTATGMSTRSARSTGPALGPQVSGPAYGRSDSYGDGSVEGGGDDRFTQGPSRRPSGLSLGSESQRERDRRKRNGLVKLLGSAFTAGPSAKLD